MKSSNATGQLAKFCGIRNDIFKPTFMEQQVLRFVAGFLKAIDADLNSLPKEFTAEIGNAKPLTHYGRAAVESLSNAFLKKLNPPKSKTQKIHYKAGFVLVLLMKYKVILQYSLSTVELVADAKSKSKGALNVADIGDEKVQMDMDQVSDYASKIFSLSPNLPAEEYQLLMLGCNDGIKALGLFEKRNDEIPDATKISILLILLGDYGECFNSVDELEQFVRQETNMNLVSDSSSFKKHCQRLGFRGARYSRSMRRGKLVDSQKRPVQ